MRNESEFKRELVRQCREKGAYARRHEDRYAIGVLDTSIKFSGHPHLLAEGKLVPHQSFAPTTRQFEEGKKYQAAGGLAVLIGWDPSTKQMYIHKWAKTATKETSYTELEHHHYADMLERWLEKEA